MRSPQDFSDMAMDPSEDGFSEPVAGSTGGVTVTSGEGDDTLYAGILSEPLSGSRDGDEITTDGIYNVDKTFSSSGEIPDNGQGDQGFYSEDALGSPQPLEETETCNDENEPLVGRFETNEGAFKNNDVQVNLTPEQDAPYLLFGLGAENPWLPDFLTNGGEGTDNPNAGIAVMLNGSIKGQGTPPMTHSGGNGKGTLKKK
jgi:hypothetical protein